ncbi:STAS domain-containing protein [Paractinoplanes atraurantiacus]|uniref:Anti-anti-sigma factor n=1 Tax=Paractinoplanes atraurantiacus TaxID=1036182 RepID=A0A285IGF6_9ACTN|nr:STAS domain-containing protein [Actinoplanes atraurantiacus]SNY47048.1 anti-anti-sigma factor [Actinoplanes atraurantiacus]
MTEINTQVLPGPTVRVFVTGEIDLSSTARLTTALTAAVDRPGAVGVEVDFAGVTFCDSTAIAVLESAWATASARALPFRLIRIRPQVAHILAIVGVLDAFTGTGQPQA